MPTKLAGTCIKNAAGTPWGRHSLINPKQDVTWTADGKVERATSLVSEWDFFAQTLLRKMKKKKKKGVSIFLHEPRETPFA
jgi:hypothetical protein